MLNSSKRVLISFLFLLLPALGAIYEVGPGKTYADPLALPWKLFDDWYTVKIYYQATPYKTELFVGWSNFTISCIP